MRWFIRYFPYFSKVVGVISWFVSIWAVVRAWVLGVSIEYVAIAFVAAIGAASFATLGVFYIGDYLDRRGEASEEGERVAKILEGLKLGGLFEIDAKRLVGIWFVDQPANESLRIAIKTGRYAQLRAAVRLGWLECANFPAHEVRSNYLISLDSAIRFFRARRWLGINPEE